MRLLLRSLAAVRRVAAAAFVRLLLRSLAAVRRVAAAVTIMTVVMVVFFLVLVADIDFGAGVNLRVIVFIDVNVTINNGAVVVTINVDYLSVFEHVLFSRLVTRRGTLATAAATRFRTVLADLTDGGGQLRRCGADHVHHRLDGLESVLDHRKDVPNVFCPLNGILRDLRPSIDQRETRRTPGFRCGVRDNADEFGNHRANQVVYLLDEGRNRRDGISELRGGACDAADNVDDLALTHQVRGHRLTRHLRHGTLPVRLQLVRDRRQRVGNGLPGDANAVHLRGVTGELVHPIFQRGQVLEGKANGSRGHCLNRTRHRSGDGHCRVHRGTRRLQGITHARRLSQGPEVLGCVDDRIGATNTLARRIDGLLHSHFLTPSKIKRRRERSSS